MYLVVQAWSSSEGGSFGDAKNWKSKNIPKKNDVVVITGDTDDLIKMEKPCVHARGNTHAHEQYRTCHSHILQALKVIN